MNRAVAGIWWSSATDGVSALVVTSAFLGIGGLLGCFSALQTSGTGAEAMATYLEQFLTSAHFGVLETPAWGECLWRALRWPVSAVLLGFTTLGVLAIPILCAFRGFLLAFSIASFARSLGRTGLLLSLVLLGLPALTAFPAFLLLSMHSLSNAFALMVRTAGQGKREYLYQHDELLRWGICATAICASLLLERYLVPQLIVELAASLPG